MRISEKTLYRAVIGGLLSVYALSAFAHDGVHMEVMGFADGFAHPFSGLDHILAMVAIGLWAAQNKRAALWVLPVCFPLMMVAGAVFARSGYPLPLVEPGIASSLAVLGLLIAFAVKMPLWSATLIVSVFGALHGYAHGKEISASSSMLLAGGGFVIATLLLHACGLGLSWFASNSRWRSLVQLGGVGIACTGLYSMLA
ncbi:HupE/UreJ family protein [Undibacterium sp. Rencai35W]|uniref:HupE/UreJ family protein n=1 Tax=Undibacterium sp. Rencai35W TaxID=3413046 RepID=UPI003BF0B496